jgi:hypothetical protein
VAPLACYGPPWVASPALGVALRTTSKLVHGGFYARNRLPVSPQEVDIPPHRCHSTGVEISRFQPEVEIPPRRCRDPTVIRTTRTMLFIRPLSHAQFPRGCSMLRTLSTMPFLSLLCPAHSVTLCIREVTRHRDHTAICTTTAPRQIPSLSHALLTAGC